MTDEPEFSLVVPLVVCAPDGPYDPESFVAGYHFSEITRVISSDPGISLYERYVYPPLVPQLDLLAAEHGYMLRSEPWDEHPDEWVRVTFYRPEEPLTA